MTDKKKATGINSLLDKYIAEGKESFNKAYNYTKDSFHNLDPKIQNAIRELPGYHNAKAIVNGTMATVNNDNSQQGKNDKYNASIALGNVTNPANLVIPSNTRTLITALKAPPGTTINGNLIHSQKDIDAMRNLVDESKYRLNEGQESYRNRYLTGNDPYDLLGIREGGTIPQYQRQGVQMVDYNAFPGQYSVFESDPKSMVLNSISNPYYRVRTTEGRFYYDEDPNGNTVVTDTYDFVPKKNGNDLYDNIREFAYKNINGKDINIRTDLGQW